MPREKSTSSSGQADPRCDDPTVFVDVMLGTAINRKSRSQPYMVNISFLDTQRGSKEQTCHVYSLFMWPILTLASD